MGPIKKKRRFSWPVAALGAICLVAGAVWAGGAIYVGKEHDPDSAFLGVTSTEEVDHPEGGARVLDVIDDSPAEEAGIEEGDIIQGFDGAPVRGPGSLSKRIEEKEPGDLVSIRLLRDDEEMTLEIELGERGDIVGWSVSKYFTPDHAEQWEEWAEEFGEKFGEDFERNWTLWADELDDSIHVLPHGRSQSSYRFLRSWGRPKLGVQLSETTPELREHFGSDDDAGVLISKVMPEMPAADAGMRVGDLIVAIDGEPVSTSAEIIHELQDKEGETFPIDVIRDGRSISIDVTIPERERIERRTGPRAYYLRPPAPPSPPSPPGVLSLEELEELTGLLESLELPELPALPEMPALPELPDPPELPAPLAPPEPEALAGPRSMKIV